jgi:hypothetical protein
MANRGSRVEENLDDDPKTEDLNPNSAQQCKEKMGMNKGF